MSWSSRSIHTPKPLIELENARDTSSQIQALRKIRNGLVGNETRKVEYIRYGLVPIIYNILPDTQTQANKNLHKTWTSDSESICTHTANLLSLLAHEGPAFVQPIFESQLLSKLLSNLVSCKLTETTLAILKFLNAVADNLPPSRPGQWQSDTRLADLLYSQYIDIFRPILDNSINKTTSQQACNSAIALICKTCHLDWHKKALIEIDMLHILSTRLASFVVAEGLVIPSQDWSDVSSVNISNMPSPAPENARLSPVLEAIAILIEQSKPRAEQFLRDSIFTTVLPPPRDDFSPSEIRKTPWGGNYFSGAAVPRSHPQNPLDNLLPYVPVPEKVTSQGQMNFPPLSSVTPMPKRRSSFLPATMEPPQLAMLEETTDEPRESSIVPWILFISREARGKRRLLAIRLLVVVHNLRLVKHSRSQSFAALLVPILVRMLNAEEARSDDHNSTAKSCLCSGLHYTKAAPGVLAGLIMDDPDMQKVAVEAKAIVKLSIGLKMTFDCSSWHKAIAWKPYKIAEDYFPRATPETSLGTGGPTSRMRHDMTYREGTLQALAAIAPFNDEYRREICDQGAVAQIMQALEPFQASDSSVGNTQESSGNSASTILAACGAVRALTRSVTALRTKLVDAEVAKAIIRLMNNNDPEVRIAATKVLANLAMDFSPMKDSVGETAVVKKLCEQAHSANAKLRLESIWALKQLVVNASKKLKQEVVDELGSSWIKLLIKTDPHDIPENEVIGLAEKDILPPTRYDQEGGTVDTTTDVAMTEADQSENNERQRHSSVHGGNSFSRHTYEDDLAIQEQVFDLVRNLFCGENASDSVEYLLREIGQEEFFKILLDRLKPRTIPGPTRKENQTSPVPAGIIVRVLYVVIHIAASNHTWRNTIATQQALIKHIATFCNHSDEEIRAQCCWLVINLTYEDDANDRAACKQRAIELHKMGYTNHLKKLEVDPKLNVRERAKSASTLMRQHIDL